MAETNIVWASTAEHFQAWDKFITSHPAGMAHLLSWYLDHQQHRMARVEMVYAQQNGEAVAGAVMYTFTLPARQRICLVPSGPLEFPGQSKSLLAVLQAIGERCAAIGAAVLQFEAFEAEMRDQIRDAFDGRPVANEPVWRLYHPTLWRELRVDLVGKTPATLLAGFSGVPRRLVQQAIKHETQVLEARSDAEIEEVHKFWIGASARKQYTIRPLESFRSMVQAAYAHDAGTLLTTRFEGRLAAFIHSAFFKVGSVFLSGGHDPTISRGWDTRLLQYRAMCMAIERGIPYYSLSGPSTGGIRLFKEGFRPALVDNMRFATIALRPLRASLMKPVVGQSRWINRLRSWAARSMRN